LWTICNFEEELREFDCSKCNSREKRKRGCNTKRVRKIDYTVECVCNNFQNKVLDNNGITEECSICGGKGRVGMSNCPLNIFNDCEISQALSSFNYYHQTECKCFPDGRSFLEQPKQLLECFTLFTRLENRKTKRELKKMRQ
jgi:hypothetical protein